MANDLDALKALLAAATPGPWHAVFGGTEISTNCDGRPGALYLAETLIRGDDGKLTCAAAALKNAALIAAAVNALPGLIEEIEQLRAKVQP